MRTTPRTQRGLFLLALCCTGVASMASIASLGGCGSNAAVSTKSTTTGRELEDLEDARDKGLLTESEYKKQREKILKGQ